MNIRKVVCAVSGGIDSAVSAYLLKKRGFDVSGLFMVNWDHVEEGESACPRTKDFADVQRVCKALDIELHLANFVKEYWHGVFLPFLDNYKQGKTVVPDIQCNSLIKFGAFYQHALHCLKADAVATGHYARTSFGDFLEQKSDSSDAMLMRAIDPLKDQTYFLSQLREEELRNTMFPVGSLVKDDVRRIAVEAGLQFLLEKRESMGICFIGKRKNFGDFLKEYIEPVDGDIVLEPAGAVIGRHDGVHNFTLGKRVAVPVESYQSADGLFASHLDASKQRLHVVEGSYHPHLFAKSIQIGIPHWITPPKSHKLLFALQRNQPLMQCSLVEDIVTPLRPMRAAAPGQMCVFYDGDYCLGGAEIVQVTETL